MALVSLGAQNRNLPANAYPHQRQIGIRLELRNWSTQFGMNSNSSWCGYPLKLWGGESQVINHFPFKLALNILCWKVYDFDERLSLSVSLYLC